MWQNRTPSKFTTPSSRRPPSSCSSMFLSLLPQISINYGLAPPAPRHAFPGMIDPKERENDNRIHAILFEFKNQKYFSHYNSLRNNMMIILICSFWLKERIMCKQVIGSDDDIVGIVLYCFSSQLPLLLLLLLPVQCYLMFIFSIELIHQIEMTILVLGIGIYRMQQFWKNPRIHFYCF